MKTHTIDFKNQLTELGRELRGVITYNDVTLEEEIYSITPHYNADLLKSVMKQLDLELTVDIPLNTVINCQIGIKVNGDYEMLNYGNYVVYKSEKQEDTGTYKITCYDKLLYSMKKNEDLGVEYPIEIKDYLIALGNKIGLSVANTTFYNQNMKIPSELYLGQEYTYRDILDEIAQATGSIICLNENDEIQVKYPTQTNDTIDEEYLKDVNVKFGEKYGAINTIVLSRSGESDNVYYPSPLPQNPVEIKIVDNQIMNFNNRSDFLEGIYNALNGLYYYINDFTSTGILYYDVGDIYNVRIGENTYQCLMLNDEVNVTTGIEEIIHTDMPEKSETDYSKADKTDMRINKTYLIVDKQNQKIESVVNNVTEQNNKISQITQTVDELSSQISDIADITTYGESDKAEVDLIDVNESEPIMIRVHPTSENISYLYPNNNLLPSDTQYLPDRIIRFTRTYEEDGTTKTKNIDYELPDDLLRYSSEVYDEFYLDYDSQTCQVIKRCKYNADGSVSQLAKEITTDYPYPTITLGEGNYTITLPGYDFGYIYVRLMAKNIYTTQFYTKVETDSRIDQKADEINLGVNQTLTNYSTTNEMNSAITLKANEITSSVNKKLENYDSSSEVNSKIEQKADSITSSVSKTYETKTNASNTYATKTQLATAKSEIKQTTDSITSTVSKKVGNDEVISKINQSAEKVSIKANKISLSGKTLNLADNMAIVSNNFKVDSNGTMTATNGNFNGTVNATSGKIGGFTLNSNRLYSGSGASTAGIGVIGKDSAFWAGSSTSSSAPFRVGHDGKLVATNADISGTVTIVGGNQYHPAFSVEGEKGNVHIVPYGIFVNSSDNVMVELESSQNDNSRIYMFSDDDGSLLYMGRQGQLQGGVHADGTAYFQCIGGITCRTLSQTSQAEKKKNFEKFNNALDILNNIDIYKFHYKEQKDDEKKHIGLVIGDNYKYSKEVTNEENDGVDIYSFVSTCCQAIKEQQQEIEDLKQQIKALLIDNKYYKGGK